MQPSAQLLMWAVVVCIMTNGVVLLCSRMPTWNRGPARRVDEDMEEDDVEISDDDEPMPVATTKGRRRPASAPSSRRVLP